MASPEQQRVLDIASFREELSRLEREGIFTIDPDAGARVQHYHDTMLATLGRQPNVDLTPEAARLSIGMRIATLLGAAALSAAYGLYVASAWGRLGLVAQLLLIGLPPLVLILLTHVASMRERSGYIASVLATVSVVALWVGLVAIGSLFNLPDTRNLLLAVGLFALLVAYLYRLGLPLLIGIVMFGGWCWSLVAIPMGLYWGDAFTFFDPMAVLGLICLVFPALLNRPRGFAPIWRTTGAVAFGAAIVLLGMNGRLSIMDGGIDRPYIEAAYQVVAFLGLSTLMVLSIRRDWTGVTISSVSFLILFLGLRLQDWFWDTLPRWVFFLLVGVLALLVLLLLRQIRMRRTVTS